MYSNDEWNVQHPPSVILTLYAELKPTITANISRDNNGVLEIATAIAQCIFLIDVIWLAGYYYVFDD